MKNRFGLEINICCGSCKFCSGIADSFTNGTNDHFCEYDGERTKVAYHSGSCSDWQMKDYYMNLDPNLGVKAEPKPARYFTWLHNELHFGISVPKKYLTMHPFSIWLQHEDSIEWRKLHPSVRPEYTVKDIHQDVQRIQDAYVDKKISKTKN